MADDLRSDLVMPALLRHARVTYGVAMHRALEEAGFGDVPRNGPYVLGGLTMDDKDVPLGVLIRHLRVSKQAAGHLIDTLVARGYLQRRTDDGDRRKLTLTLTGRGHAAAAVQRVAREKIDAELLEKVGKDNLARTRKTLAALIAIGGLDS